MKYLLLLVVIASVLMSCSFSPAKKCVKTEIYTYGAKCVKFEE